MKLMRVGPVGAERPAVLGADGAPRDLSDVVADVDGALLADPAAMDRGRAAAAGGARGAGPGPGGAAPGPAARPDREDRRHRPHLPRPRAGDRRAGPHRADRV